MERYKEIGEATGRNANNSYQMEVNCRETTEDIGYEESADDHPTLWHFCTPKAFTAAERNVILRICAPESKVLSKGKCEHIDVFWKHNITYLKIMAAIEDKNIELT